ncbi:MAG: hypothetical protein R2701_13060 [Acidimicrobiales bacterium]
MDDDLDDERSTGSVGIEDRNLLARLIVSAADVVAIVAAPAPWGTEDLEHLHARSRALARRDARFVISQAARPSDAWRARPLTELLVALARADGPTPIQAPPPVAIEPGELGGWDDRC